MKEIDSLQGLGKIRSFFDDVLEKESTMKEQIDESVKLAQQQVGGLKESPGQ